MGMHVQDSAQADMRSDNNRPYSHEGITINNFRIGEYADATEETTSEPSPYSKSQIDRIRMRDFSKISGRNEQIERANEKFDGQFT